MPEEPRKVHFGGKTVQGGGILGRQRETLSRVPAASADGGSASMFHVEHSATTAEFEASAARQLSRALGKPDTIRTIVRPGTAAHVYLGNVPRGTIDQSGS